jgi:RNA polymerase sigma-70 factor (ECF subfamily)
MSDTDTDAVRETHIRAWAGMRDFGGTGSRRAWMFGIATHIWLDRLREPRRVP